MKKVCVRDCHKLHYSFWDMCTDSTAGRHCLHYLVFSYQKNIPRVETDGILFLIRVQKMELKVRDFLQGNFQCTQMNQSVLERDFYTSYSSCSVMSPCVCRFCTEKNETEPHFQTKITFVQNTVLASRPQILRSTFYVDVKILGLDANTVFWTKVIYVRKFAKNKSFLRSFSTKFCRKSK